MNKSQLEKILKLRDRIDQVDSRILKLIQQRATFAKSIGNIKSKDPNNQSFYRPDREAKIIRQVLKSNEGGLVKNEQLKYIYKELISACLSLEESLKIAYLGPEGTHSESAVIGHFGSSVQRDPRASIDDVFKQLTTGQCNFGVVPVENSSEGVVNPTLNCLADEDVTICGETYLSIHHYLASGNTKDFKQAKQIASHPQALGQCTKWIEANLPGIKRKMVSSTAEAAMLASKDSNTLCIAGKLAVEKYKLHTHVKNIEDFSENRTRFLIIGKDSVEKTGLDKTSLLVQTSNRPGALLELLKPFNKAKINLHRIETRPSRKSVDTHNFFIDCDGHIKDKNIKLAINAIKQAGAFVRVLGSYPLEIN